MSLGRRLQLSIVFTLLWTAIGNAALHLDLAANYGIAVLVAVAVWAVTGAITDKRQE